MHNLLKQRRDRDMALFTSSREKRLWFYAMLVFLAIFSTLVLGRPLQKMLRDQNVQAVFFLLGMISTGVTVIVNGLKVQPSKTEIVLWLGLTAVFIMFVFRLGAPERSHLMEYVVLAIFIHKALSERLVGKKRALIPALLAFTATVIIGVIDECVQLFLPDRVFDLVDIQFNSLAALMAIGGSLTLQWARGKFGKKI